LETEIERLQNENKKLKEVFSRILAEASQLINIETN
jgi:hypothetical protein